MSESTVAIVGAGIVGATLAYLLTQKGYDVDIFEKGPEYLYPHSMQFNEQVLNGYDNPTNHLSDDIKSHTFSGIYGGDLEVERDMTVGGSSTRWEGITLRMRPNDFKTKSLYGYGEDWPLTYDELEPYYCRAEALLGVSGTDADNPFAPPRSQSYPLPPFELGYDDRVLAERLHQHNIVLHTTPQARTRSTYEGRAGCVNFGTCVVCPIGARYSPNHHLQLTLATGLCKIHPNTSVRRIGLNKKGRPQALFYQINDSSSLEEHNAKVIIVAAGALESARLLLLSANDRFPDGLGNKSGHVGQHLLFHHLWGSRLRYREPLYPERVGAWTGQIHQFLDPPNRGKHGGIKIEFSSRLGYVAHEAMQMRWRHGSDIIEDLKPRLHWRWSAFHAESIPSSRKYLTLSEQRDRFGDPFVHVHYEPVAFDHETYHFAQDLFKQIMAATKAEEGELRADHEFNSGAHHLGACRIGHQVEDSVANPFGQVHEIPNLFVVGGSNFAGTSALNPTLTMVALAIRSADYMIDQVL